MMLAVMAIVANAADYYLIGGFNKWTLKDANSKFTAKGDGTYELDYAGILTSGFKINDGTWGNGDDNFGGSAMLELGKEYNLTTGSTSGNIPMASNVENPHLVFNPAARTLLVTGQSQEVEIKYGIHGDIFGDPLWSTEDFVEKDGKWVMENKTVVAGNFGIKKMDKGTNSQLDWISSAAGAAVVLDTPMACQVGGTNWSIDGGTFNFTFDPEAMTLTVTGESKGPVYTETLYLIGEPVGGWAANVGEELQGKEGVFTYNADFTKLTYFGFATKLGETAADWDTLNANRYGSNQTVGDEDSFSITEAGIYTMQKPNGNAWNLPAGQWTLTINTVDNTLTVAGQGVEPPVPSVPETLYVLGNVAGNSWDPSAPIEMTKDGNKFTVDAVVDDAGEGFGFFSFCTSKSETPDDWGGLNSGDRFGPAEADELITPGTPVEYTVYKEGVNASACASWKIAASEEYHKYIFTVDFDKKTVTVDVESGVESIVAGEAGEAVYYNLQGVRVSNPENGIFVRVAEGKAVKVVK